MAKEWILNSAMNRFHLNFKKNVGATSESIRKCAPKNLDEWRDFYYANVRSEAQIEELGKKLHLKITEVLQSEIFEITEQDCVDYMKNLVINRTYDGYTTEITTIYGQLARLLDVEVKAAPDKWDRLYNIDFYIQVGKFYIGLQIKPVNQGVQMAEIYKEYAIQEKTHEKFKKKFGGNIFYLFSRKINGKKEIANKEVVENIRKEIERLAAF